MPITSPTKNQHKTSIVIKVLIQASFTGVLAHFPLSAALDRSPNPFKIAGISAGVGGYNSVLAKRLNSRSLTFEAKKKKAKIISN